MKGVYFSNCNLNDLCSGVSKKIKMQVKALTLLNNNIVVPNVYVCSLFEKIYTKLPFVSTFYDYKVSAFIKHELNHVDFAYFRHDVFTKKLIKNISQLKKKGITVLYEIPTYPYDLNNRELINFFVRQKDLYWRNKITGIVDYIVDYSGHAEIFGCKTINIINGIDISFVSERNYIPHGDTINLLGVALLAKVHGFDRIINSMKQYYECSNSPEIVFHIVGDGDEKNNLEKLVKTLGLEDKVLFYGRKGGDELDDIYNRADIGIGSLGIHRRIKGQIVSSLKTKEYCAKGLPFITSEQDEAFSPNEFPFMYMCGQDEKIIDLCKVVDWYNKLARKYENTQNIADIMRDYAAKKLSWKTQMSKVLATIDSIG